MKHYKITFLTIPFITSLTCLIFAQAPDTLWTKNYGGIRKDFGTSVQECAIGGFIVAGETESWSTYLIRTDENGDTIWTKTYNIGRAFSVQECTSGGFVITGQTADFGPTVSDVFLTRINESGNIMWTKTYGGDYSESGNCVQECVSGGFIIAGGTGSFGVPAWDVYLIRTDEDGDTLWTKTFGMAGIDAGNSVQECANGDFVIAGFSRSSSTAPANVYLIRTDVNGNPLWTKTYGGNSSDYGESVQECDSGGFIVGGSTSSFGVGGSDVYLIRANENGDTLWTKTYGGVDTDYGKSIQECSSGGFIIAGRTKSFGAGSDDVYLVRTNENGDTLWTTTYGGVQSDRGMCIQECRPGGFITAGYTWSFGDSANFYLIRIGAEGAIEEQKLIEPILLNIKISPNPFIKKTKLHFQGNAGAQETILRIYNASGRLVKPIKLETNTYQLGTDLTPGIYFLKLNDKVVGKVVKVR